MYVKKSLAAIPNLVAADFSEHVWCDIPMKGSDRLLISCIYRSPYSTTENKLNSALQEICRGRSPVMIAGDFNYLEVNWQENFPCRSPAQRYSFLGYNKRP